MLRCRYEARGFGSVADARVASYKPPCYNFGMLSDMAILERVINPAHGDFSPDLARHVLGLEFPPADHARCAELSAKAQDGTLTDEERSELEDYLSVNDFLAILKAKAEVSITKQDRSSGCSIRVPTHGQHTSAGTGRDSLHFRPSVE